MCVRILGTALTFFFLFLLTTQAIAQGRASFSSRQIEILTLAYHIAKKDGHADPAIVQGIIMQETLAGEYPRYAVAGQEFGLKPFLRYYGLGQIKLAAAKDVLKQYPQMYREYSFHTQTDDEILAKLIENDRFNIAVTSKYILILKRYGYTTNAQLATAYNMGPGGAKGVDFATFAYSIKVQTFIVAIRLNQMLKFKTTACLDTMNMCLSKIS